MSHPPLHQCVSFPRANVVVFVHQPLPSVALRCIASRNEESPKRRGISKLIKVRHTPRGEKSVCGVRYRPKRRQQLGTIYTALSLSLSICLYAIAQQNSPAAQRSVCWTQVGDSLSRLAGSTVDVSLQPYIYSDRCGEALSVARAGSASHSPCDVTAWVGACIMRHACRLASVARLIPRRHPTHRTGHHSPASCAWSFARFLSTLPGHGELAVKGFALGSLVSTSTDGDASGPYERCA
jgi:hypothetical protein